MPGALLRPFPILGLAAAAVCAGVVGFTASAGVRDDMLVASVVALLAAAATAWMLARRPGFAALVARPPALARTLFVVGTLAVGVQLAWLTPFVIDPYIAAWPAGVARPWQSGHSCVSAYWVAAQQATAVPDLYRRHSLPAGDAVPACDACRTSVRSSSTCSSTRRRSCRCPACWSLGTPDFWRFRRLWFALNLAGVVLGLVAIARRVDAPLGTHAVWLTPWVLGGAVGHRHAAGRQRAAAIPGSLGGGDAALRAAPAGRRRPAARLCHRQQALSRRARALPAAPPRLARPRLDRRRSALRWCS